SPLIVTGHDGDCRRITATQYVSASARPRVRAQSTEYRDIGTRRRRERRWRARAAATAQKARSRRRPDLQTWTIRHLSAALNDASAALPALNEAVQWRNHAQPSPHTRSSPHAQPTTSRAASAGIIGSTPVSSENRRSRLATVLRWQNSSAALAPMLPEARYARTASTRRCRSTGPQADSAVSTSARIGLPAALRDRAANRAQPRRQVIAESSSAVRT